MVRVPRLRARLNGRSSLLARTLAAAAAGALAGCTPKAMALKVMTPMLQDGAKSVTEEDDPQLAREAMPAQLKMLEGMLSGTPEHPVLLRMLAEGFTGYGALFIEDEDPGRARALYRRAMGYGQRLAALNAALRDLEGMAPEALEAALRGAGPSDVPALFWTALAWGSWINLSKDSPEAVANLSRPAAIMRRVLELDPAFHFSGPDLFLGSFNASLPPAMGGNLKESRRHFEAALERTGGRYLLAHVLYAQHYAVAAQDAELFKELARRAMEPAAGESPGARLANRVAASKARRLLEKVDDLF